MIMFSKSSIAYISVTVFIIAFAIIINLFDILPGGKYNGDSNQDPNQFIPEGWKEYKNEVFNYGFGYPSEFDLIKDDTSSLMPNDPKVQIVETLTLESGDPGQEVLFIHVFNNPGLQNLRDLIAWPAVSSNFSDDLSIGFISINNMPAAVFSDSNHQKIGVYVIAGNKIYSIFRYHFDPDHDTTKPLFKQIYGTLKITN